METTWDNLSAGGVVAEAVSEKFAATADLEVSVKALDVNVHGMPADAEVSGGLFLAVAGEKSLQRLALARRKGAIEACDWRERPKLHADHPAEVGDDAAPGGGAFAMTVRRACDPQHGRKVADLRTGPFTHARLLAGIRPARAHHLFRLVAHGARLGRSIRAWPVTATPNPDGSSAAQGGRLAGNHAPVGRSAGADCQDCFRSFSTACRVGSEG